MTDRHDAGPSLDLLYWLADDETREAIAKEQALRTQEAIDAGDLERYGDGGLVIHARGKCASEFCPFHNPSDHHMNTWALTVRVDRPDLLTERICEHGVGHPDPDSLAWIEASDPGNDRSGVHGCDGCCWDGTEAEEPAATALDDNEHYFKTEGSNWALQHAVACRPNLLGCPIHEAVNAFDKPPVADGFYLVKHFPDSEGLHFISTPEPEEGMQ